MVIGIVCAVVIKPGIGISTDQKPPEEQPGILAIDKALDIFRYVKTSFCNENKREPVEFQNNLLLGIFSLPITSRQT